MTPLENLCGLSPHLLAGLRAYAHSALEAAGYLPTPDRVADLAFGLSMAHLQVGQPPAWQYQALEFPSGVHTTPYTLFGLYDIEPEHLESILAALPA